MVQSINFPSPVPASPAVPPAGEHATTNSSPTPPAMSFGTQPVYRQGGSAVRHAVLAERDSAMSDSHTAALARLPNSTLSITQRRPMQAGAAASSTASAPQHILDEIAQLSRKSPILMREDVPPHLMPFLEPLFAEQERAEAIRMRADDPHIGIKDLENIDSTIQAPDHAEQQHAATRMRLEAADDLHTSMENVLLSILGPHNAEQVRAALARTRHEAPDDSGNSLQDIVALPPGFMEREHASATHMQPEAPDDSRISIEDVALFLNRNPPQENQR